MRMGRKPQFVVSEETLRDLYVARSLSHRDIAAQFGCSMETVRYWLLKYGIPMRGKGKATKFHVEEQHLRKRYLEDNWTTGQIAEELKCGSTVVWRAIHQYGLQLDLSEQGRRRTERNKVRYAHQRMSGGYRYVKNEGHPLANSNGYVTEHRISAEIGMGRGLVEGERVHHINLDKHDNAPTNLAVLPTQAIHRMVHEYLDRCGAFLCGLNKVRPEPLDFGRKVFWGGRWVTQIDLIPAEPQVSFAQYDSMFAAASPPSVN